MMMAAALAGGCRPQEPEALRYLHDRAYRRAALEASLVNPANDYSRRRLDLYAVGDRQGWDALPEWNPRCEGVQPSELGADLRPGRPLAPEARALRLSPAASAGEEQALQALGEDAFFHYPVQLAPHIHTALASRQSAARYGLWIDPRHGVGGVVRVELADGHSAFAYTCATCHAAPRAGGLVVGLGNDRLDLGRLALEGAPDLPPEVASNLLRWRPGLVDVTTRTGREPVALPDLRPTRWLTHLQYDATVAQRNLTSLAIRIETLILTSQGEALRPPRVVALGLASYLWSLAASVPPRAPRTQAEERGLAVFSARCARCHAPPGLTGPPVALAAVGTDPAFGQSSDRGTGAYRVPSLHGVRDRRLLFHDGSLSTLEDVLDGSRRSPDFQGGARGPGPVPGHPFGFALGARERAELLVYLHTL
jgi:hypothetical protein